jgi:endogenous inhibitor of DNA gyrase (YacG/DUF329 family)
MRAKCPYCGKEIEIQGNQWRPFCSKSCKILDLWNWVNEAYSIKLDETEQEQSKEFQDENKKI